MMGDYHVRCCERHGVKLPLSTRPYQSAGQASKKQYAQGLFMDLPRTGPTTGFV